MPLYIIKEPNYANSTWSIDSIEGLVAEAKRRRITVKDIETKEKLISMQFKEKDVIVVIGSSFAWLINTISICNLKVENRVIVLSNQAHKFLNAEYSLVSSDILSSMQLILEYLRESDKDRPALYGINPNSAADTFRVESFKIIYRDDKHIFENNGSLEKCFNNFYPQIDKFNAIICANDYAAISLLHRLKQLNYNKINELFIISYANTVLSRHYSPSISSISMNFFEFGKAAVNIYKYMQRDLYFSSMNINVKWELHERATTQNIPMNASRTKNIQLVHEVETDNFYTDPEILEMLNVEKILNDCDDTTLEILKSIINGNTYDEIAEKVFMSVNGVKYRVKNMISMCNVKSKNDFIKIIKKYICPHVSPLQ